MLRKTKDVDQEIYYKQAFRVFYKDSSGCVPAEELKSVLSNLMVRKGRLMVNGFYTEKKVCTIFA